MPLPSCGKPALVVELKYDKTADSAIQQIKAALIVMREEETAAEAGR